MTTFTISTDNNIHPVCQARGSPRHADIRCEGIHQPAGPDEADCRPAHGTAGRDLGRLLRSGSLWQPQAGQEVHGSQDGARPNPAGGIETRACYAPGGRRCAEGRTIEQGATVATDAAPTAPEGSKKAIVLDLLRREQGATLAEIAKATDRDNHSTRLHERDDYQEDGAQGRQHQARERRRPHMPGRELASACLQPPPGTGGGFRSIRLTPICV